MPFLRLQSIYAFLKKGDERDPTTACALGIVASNVRGLSPDIAKAHFEHAKSGLKSERLKKLCDLNIAVLQASATGDVKAALLINPETIMVKDLIYGQNVRIIDLLHLRGKFKKLEKFCPLIYSDFNHPEFCLNIAYCKFMQGKIDEALEVLNKVGLSQKDPKTPDPLITYFQELYAIIVEMKGDRSLEIKDFTNALINKEEPSFFNYWIRHLRGLNLAEVEGFWSVKPEVYIWWRVAFESLCLHKNVGLLQEFMMRSPDWMQSEPHIFWARAEILFHSGDMKGALKFITLANDFYKIWPKFCKRRDEIQEASKQTNHQPVMPQTSHQPEKQAQVRYPSEPKHQAIALDPDAHSLVKPGSNPREICKALIVLDNKAVLLHDRKLQAKEKKVETATSRAALQKPAAQKSYPQGDSVHNGDIKFLERQITYSRDLLKPGRLPDSIRRSTLFFSLFEIVEFLRNKEGFTSLIPLRHQMRHNPSSFSEQDVITLLKYFQTSLPTILQFIQKSPTLALQFTPPQCPKDIPSNLPILFNSCLSTLASVEKIFCENKYLLAQEQDYRFATQGALLILSHFLKSHNIKGFNQISWHGACLAHEQGEAEVLEYADKDVVSTQDLYAAALLHKELAKAFANVFKK